MAAVAPTATFQVPILPIHERVLFPRTVLSLTVGRPTSVALVKAEFDPETVGTRGRTLGVFTCIKDEDELYKVGCLARVDQVTTLVKGNIVQQQLVVCGVQPIEVLEVMQTRPYRVARVRLLDEISPTDEDAAAAFANELLELGKEYVQYARRMQGLAGIPVQQLERTSPGDRAYILAFLCQAPVEEKQKVLEATAVQSRLELAVQLVCKALEHLKASAHIQSKVKETLRDRSRRMVLEQQLKEIQKELGGDEQSVIDNLRQRLDAAQMPEAARIIANKELAHLKVVPEASPEYSMLLNYLELLADLPWGKTTPDEFHLRSAQDQLDADHYGLEQIKRRILEYLAVRRLNPSASSPILCLVGPPGVGKTSLGRSIAAALKRPFVRVSLGGMRDVAEIRGHRRTYVGALPGTFISALRRAGTKDPVMLLDEIDKLGSEFRGDPAAALLEVLDPEQNCTFVDHYLATPFDLSRVFFIATANRLDTLPPALLDRMEVIELSGYTLQQKLFIAREHLVPKLFKTHGLTTDQVRIGDAALTTVINHYAREAGVRVMERCMSALCRHVAVQMLKYHEEHTPARPIRDEAKAAVDEVPRLVAADQPNVATDDMPAPQNSAAGAGAGAAAETATESSTIITEPEPLHLEGFAPVVFDSTLVEQVLGPHKYEFQYVVERSLPGVVAGLAWTPTGGELMYVEAAKMEGSGHLKLTGKLGEVMKESAHAALTWIRAHALQLGLPSQPMEHIDIHLHFPQGAIPKDGPSAGVAIVSALISALTGTPARKDTAMTGEITLRGAVLRVGGVSDKLLGAHRSGIRRVVIPAANKDDLDELSQEVLNDLTILLVSEIDELLCHVFEASPLLTPHRVVKEPTLQAVAAAAPCSAAIVDPAFMSCL